MENTDPTVKLQPELVKSKIRNSLCENLSIAKWEITVKKTIPLLFIGDINNFLCDYPLKHTDFLLYFYSDRF